MGREQKRSQFRVLAAPVKNQAVDVNGFHLQGGVDVGVACFQVLLELVETDVVFRLAAHDTDRGNAQAAAEVAQGRLRDLGLQGGEGRRGLIKRVSYCFDNDCRDKNYDD